MTGQLTFDNFIKRGLEAFLVILKVDYSLMEENLHKNILKTVLTSNDRNKGSPNVCE